MELLQSSLYHRGAGLSIYSLFLVTYNQSDSVVGKTFIEITDRGGCIGAKAVCCVHFQFLFLSFSCPVVGCGNTDVKESDLITDQMLRRRIQSHKRQANRT